MATPLPPPAPPPPPPPAPKVIEDDVDAALQVAHHGDLTLNIGAMIQVQGAFFVGDQAARQFDDPFDTEGFRIRRARFGFGGRLLRHVAYYLAVDLKDTVGAATGGDAGTEILDARLTWDRFEPITVSAGVDKVPISIFNLRSSSKLIIIERPLSVNLLIPGRRVGVTASGSFGFGGRQRVSYAAGVYNGSSGVTTGNQLAGIAGAVFARYDLTLGAVDVTTSPRVTVAGGYMFDKTNTATVQRGTVATILSGFGVALAGELYYFNSRPDDVPDGTPDAGEVTRRGAAAQASAFVWRPYLELAFRYEYFEDNDRVPTFGKQQLFTGGLNLYLCGHKLKLQINYVHRQELEGPTVENDVGFAQLQGKF